MGVLNTKSKYTNKTTLKDEKNKELCDNIKPTDYIQFYEDPKKDSILRIDLKSCNPFRGIIWRLRYPMREEIVHYSLTCPIMIKRLCPICGP